MNEIVSASDFGSYAALYRRRRVWIWTIIPGALLLSIYLAYAITPKYRSTATVILEQASIPQEFIQATVNSSADEEIETIQGRVMVPDAMRELVRQVDPYPNQPDWSLDKKAQEVIANTVMERVDPVTFESLLKSSAFSLHYDNPNPRMAAVIAQRLSDLFLSYHQHQRVEAATAAAKLIEDRANALSQELQGIDDQFARLRMQHGGTLPDSSDRGEEARYRAARDLDEQEKELRTAQQQESLLSIQLASMSPNLLATQGLAMQGGQPSAQSGMTDLATVKALLADAELRYTPDHPDVKRLKRALAVLQAQQGTRPGGVAQEADNPEYRRISSELASARSEVKALQVSTARARSQLDQYTANSNPSAALERQVADLERRRTSLQTQFQEVQSKLKGAQLGQTVEADGHAEHFSLIRAPIVATTPYSPNRVGVILLGLIVGFGLAAVAVSAAESADATVRGARDIVGFESIPFLASVSEILRPQDVRRRRLIWGSVSAVYLALAVFVAITVIHAESRDYPTQVSGTT
jgi:polysaccharide biosynthesis transport protein